MKRQLFHVFFAEAVALCFGYRINSDNAALAAVVSEVYDTVSQCVQSVVTAHTHVLSGVVYCASLTNQNVACYAALTAKNLNT